MEKQNTWLLKGSQNIHYIKKCLGVRMRQYMILQHIDVLKFYFSAVGENVLIRNHVSWVLIAVPLAQ